MNRIASRRGFAALGIAVALAMAAGVRPGAAQTAPQPLPNLQNQQPNSQNDRRDDRQPGGPYERRAGRGFPTAQERLERRLDFLHMRIGIAPAQEKAWTDFANVLRVEARDRGRDLRGGRGPGSVVERLEERQHMLSDRSAELDRVIGALRPLYASFSDEQKRTADRLMFMPLEERFGGRGFTDRGPGGPGGPGFVRFGPERRF